MNRPSQGAVFEIDREAVRRYFYTMHLMYILLVGAWFVGLGFLVAAVHAVTWGPSLSRQQAGALRYWLDGGTLRVDLGVFVLKRKAIPLDRVTDVILTQGPLMRRYGIWGPQIQTAGTGQATPEATLYGLTDPEAIRDQLLAARDRLMDERRLS